MNFMKDKVLDLLIALISIFISSILSIFIELENDLISHTITILVFLTIFLICKYFKKFINPFCVTIDFKNSRNTMKPNETELILRENGKDIKTITPENHRSVETITTLTFQNTISRYIIGNIISRNKIYLNFYTDIETLKLTTNKVSKISDKSNPRSLLIDISYTSEKLASSNFTELETKKEKTIIVEYIGTEFFDPEKTNLHVSFYTKEWNSKIDWIIFKMFYDINMSNNHDIYIRFE